MSREKLAYVVSIKEIKNITGKDRIGLASFNENEWEVIVNKSDFNPGNLCIYIEYDTVLPVIECFEFLRKRSYREKYNGFVIGAMKMASHVSYGIAFTPEQVGLKGVRIGQDVTKELGIKSKDDVDIGLEALQGMKHTKPKGFWKKLSYYLSRKYPRIMKLFLNPRKIYNYPISKTDETRVENLPYVYETLAGKEVDITLKQDGSSIGISVIDGFFSLMSRNNVIIGAPLEKLMKLDRHLTLDEWIKKVDKITHSVHFNSMPHVLKICYEKRWFEMAFYLQRALGNFGIQGELCGPGIQGNPLKLSSLEWYVFNLKDRHDQYYRYECISNYLRYVEKEMTTNVFTMKIEQVPLIYTGKFKWKNKQELKDLAAECKYGDDPAEGIVLRFYRDYQDYYFNAERGMSNMCSFKCINDLYVLKQEK